MILSSIVSTLPLISGTISFFPGSILHAEELSITIDPASANFGAHSRDVPPPAEKMAISGTSLQTSPILLTVYSLPLNFKTCPTDLADATRYNSSNGKLLSSSTLRISWPTSPVAPTTASFILFIKFKRPAKIRVTVVPMKNIDQKFRFSFLKTFTEEIFLSLLLLLTTQQLFAQVDEKFDDGNFVENPSWTGNLDRFDATSHELHLKAPAEAGTSYLSTPSTAILNAAWQIHVTLQF